MNTQDYRIAPGGEGPQAATWKDKPHRLVYDLCGEVERLQDLQGALAKRGYPKLLIYRGKHGDRHILITDEAQEHDAWLMMFRTLYEWNQCYYDMEGDEAKAYAAAKGGCGWAANWLLQQRNGGEYESVEIEHLETPTSMEGHLYD